ncbi:MAG: nucleotidyltransferase family protein [Spirochaetota bacterium]
MDVHRLSDEQRSAVEELAEQYLWQLVVLFGSALSAPAPRDIDIAVLPESEPDLLTLGRWTRRLEAVLGVEPVDLLALTDRLSPITRFQVFRTGVCLFERTPGLFGREQDRAFFLYADTAVFRRQVLKPEEMGIDR